MGMPLTLHTKLEAASNHENSNFELPKWLIPKLKSFMSNFHFGVYFAYVQHTLIRARKLSSSIPNFFSELS